MHGIMIMHVYNEIKRPANSADSRVQLKKFKLYTVTVLLLSFADRIG